MWIPLWSSYDHPMISMIDHPCFYRTSERHRSPSFVGYILAVCCSNLHAFMLHSLLLVGYVSRFLGERSGTNEKSGTSMTHIKSHFFLFKWFVWFVLGVLKFSIWWTSSPQVASPGPLRRAHADDTFDHRRAVGLVGALQKTWQHRLSGLVSNGFHSSEIYGSITHPMVSD